MDSIIPSDDTPTKCCPDCPKEEQWHPATTGFFGRDKNQKDGLCRVCKKCKNAYSRAYSKRPESRAYQKEWKNRPENRVRQRASQRAYRSKPENREQAKATRQAYESRPDIREKRKAYYKPYFEAFNQSPEYHAYQEAYANNPEVQKRKQEYRESPHYKELHRANSHQRRARQKAVPGTYTPKQIQEQLKRQKRRCYYCQQALTKYHIEHVVPLSRGGSNDISNIVLACPSCNQRKNSKLPHEWSEGGHLL